MIKSPHFEGFFLSEDLSLKEAGTSRLHFGGGLEHKKGQINLTF